MEQACKGVFVTQKKNGELSYRTSLTYKNKQDAVEFAVAASALKHTIPGDFNQVRIKEVETLMKGDGSGRVSR